MNFITQEGCIIFGTNTCRATVLKLSEEKGAGDCDRQTDRQRQRDRDRERQRETERDGERKQEKIYKSLAN